MEAPGVTGQARFPATGFEHPDRGPTAFRTALGARLRGLRKRNRKSLKVAGAVLGASAAKLSRLERGRGACKEADVAALLTFYEVTAPDERDEILNLVHGANAPAWWEEFRDILPPRAVIFLGLEQAASTIITYHSQRIPDLLQTPNYTRALGKISYPRDRDIDRRVPLLERRQQILTRPGPPQCNLLIDEAALLRPVSTPIVMREQMAHLLKLHIEQPNVTLRVIPMRHGGQAAMLTPFTLLGFVDEDLQDIVCLDQLTGTLYIRKPEDVDWHRQACKQLCPDDYDFATETSNILERLLK